MSDSSRPHGLYSSWNYPGQNTEVSSLSLLQGIFQTQGSNPGLLHCSRILHQLSHKGSPTILKWVTYPFSSRSSRLRNRTRVSCIACRFSTNWAIREALRTSLVAQTVKRLPIMRETWVRSLGQEDSLEKEMVTHSSILAWKIPWTEERGRLHSMGSQRVDWVTSLHFLQNNNTLWNLSGISSIVLSPDSLWPHGL